MVWWFACVALEPGAVSPGSASDTEAYELITSPPGPSPQSLLHFSGDAPANFIVVSLDTTRRDFVGRYGGAAVTPHLDRFLTEGVALDNHWSCSNWTGPAMTCVVTGNSPLDLGWWPLSADSAVPSGDPDLPSLAQLFRAQRGYTTGLITANVVFDRLFHFDRGFDKVQRLHDEPAAAITTAGLDAAQALLEAQAPFYLHLHYMDPHAGYCPPPAFVDRTAFAELGVDLCRNLDDLVEERFPREDATWQAAFQDAQRELYRAEISYWDSEFGRLWRGLDELGALDDALVLFVTDHGEQLFERGEAGHGRAMGPEELRATAGFWSKTLQPHTWTGPTQHQDLGVTVHDYFGFAAPEGATGTLLGTAPIDRPLGALHYRERQWARLSVVHDNQQLTYDWWGDVAYFDLETDPGGLANAYNPELARVRAMQRHMDALIAEVGAGFPNIGAPTPAW